MPCTSRQMMTTMMMTMTIMMIHFKRWTKLIAPGATHQLFKTLQNSMQCQKEKNTQAEFMAASLLLPKLPTTLTFLKTGASVYLNTTVVGECFCFLLLILNFFFSIAASLYLPFLSVGNYEHLQTLLSDFVPRSFTLTCFLIPGKLYVLLRQFQATFEVLFSPQGHFQFPSQPSHPCFDTWITWYHRHSRPYLFAL